MILTRQKSESFRREIASLEKHFFGDDFSTPEHRYDHWWQSDLFLVECEIASAPGAGILGSRFLSVGGLLITNLADITRLLNGDASEDELAPYDRRDSTPVAYYSGMIAAGHGRGMSRAISMLENVAVKSGVVHIPLFAIACTEAGAKHADDLGMCPLNSMYLERHRWFYAPSVRELLRRSRKRAA